MVLHPKSGHQIVVDSSGNLFISVGRRGNAQQPVHRGHHAEGVDRVGLGNAVAVEPRWAFHVIPSAPDRSVRVDQGRQVFGGQVDRSDLGRQPRTVERSAKDHVCVLNIRWTGKRRKRIPGHPMLV